MPYRQRDSIGRATYRRLWLPGLASLALGLAWNAPAAAQDTSKSDDQKAAGETAKKDKAALGEIVVTAQFRQQALQDVPMSITAVNSDQIAQRSITNVVDIAQAAPNVTMTEAGNGFGKTNQAFIRGIGQLDFSFAFEPKVGFYIDDVYYSTTFGSVFELLDIDRVEIERGPQGTLNGRNSVGGAIRIFNKKPQGDNSGYVEASYGSYNHYIIKGGFDVPVVKDKVALRIAAGYNSRDGWVDRINFACANPTVAGTLPQPGLNNGGGIGGTRNGCKVGTLGGGDIFTSRGQLRIMGDTWEDNIEADYTDDQSEAPAETLLPGTNGVSFQDNTLLPDGSGPARPPNTPNGLGVFLGSWGQYYGLANPLVTPSFPAQLQNPLSPGAAALLKALNPQDPYVSYAIYGNPGAGDPQQQFDNPPISTVKSWGVSNNLEINLSDALKLVSITAYRRYTGAFGSSDFALPTREAYNEVAHHQFTQEVRLLGSALDGRLHYTLGGFYLDSFNDNSGRIQTAGFAIFAGPLAGTIPFILDMYVDDQSTVQNISGFAHADFDFNDIFSIEGGVRYTHETKGYSYFRQTVGQAPSLQSSSPDTTIDEWNPRISLNAQVTPDVLLYASFSTGFTSGGNDPRPFFPGDVNLTFGPEQAKAYEVGFKSLWLDRRVRFNAAAFWTDYNDIQTFLLGNTTGCAPGTQPAGQPPCTIFYYGNGGDATIKGFEAELEMRLVPEWLVTAAVGYTDFKYKSLAANVNPTNDLNGTTLNSPQTQVPKWKLTFGTQYDIDLGTSGRLVPHVDVTYQSSVHYSPSLIDPLSTQPGYTLVNARVTWHSADDSWQVAGYVTNLTDKLYYTSLTNLLNGFGYAYGQVGRPREWGISVRRSF